MLTELLHLLGNLPTFVAAYVAAVLATPQQMLAHVGALLGVGFVVAAAFWRTMVPLRWLAVGSNLGFIVYGALRPSPTTLAVAALLLPINLWRAAEMMRLTHRVRQASANADAAALWLKPYMKKRRRRAGQVLFNKGDVADRLYLLVQGELEVVGTGGRIPPGMVFGEVALFSPDHKRTQTVRCLSACTLLDIHEDTVYQLCFQNPAFGFHLNRLLAEHLAIDITRMEAQLREKAAAP
jgi:CRP-like cAMP-binding protein